VPPLKIKLSLTPLSRESFSPYGEVIEAAGESALINDGTCERFGATARMDAALGGRMALSVFRAAARTPPLALRMLERHPLASQAFMPLGGARFIIVVAPPGDKEIAPDEIKAFIARDGQGVNIARGVWHHPLIALVGGDFLVAERESDNGNLDVRRLPAGLGVDWSGA
jgi:ureidoglycolate lyase